MCPCIFLNHNHERSERTRWHRSQCFSIAKGNDFVHFRQNAIFYFNTLLLRVNFHLGINVASHTETSTDSVVQITARKNMTVGIENTQFSLQSSLSTQSVYLSINHHYHLCDKHLMVANKITFMSKTAFIVIKTDIADCLRCLCKGVIS